MFLSFGAMAQREIDKPLSGLEIQHEQNDVTPIVTKTNADYKKKAIETGWLSPVSMWESQGAFWQSPSFYRLFPDSGVVNVPSDGSAPFYQAWHSFGTVFEPTDPFYSDQTSTGWRMDRFDTYDVDSLRFSYGYFRDVDSMMVGGVNTAVVDTIIVQFYKPESLSRWYIGGVGEWENHVFTMPNGQLYNPKTVTAHGNAWNDTILLTQAFETPLVDGSFNIGQIRVAVPDSVKAFGENYDLAGRHTAGMSITYKPGQPYSFGDTLANFNDNVTVKNQLNNFGAIVFFNEGAGMEQDRHANNSFVTNRQVIAGNELFDLFRGYLATMATAGWNNDFFFDGDFYVTADVEPGSVNNINTLSIKAYPNPATAGQTVAISIDENASINDVRIELTDVLGNVVSNEFTSNGNNTYSVATNGVTPGVYFINVNANNSTGTVRVIIAE